jgi:HlyD family secretion protein
MTRMRGLVLSLAVLLGCSQSGPEPIVGTVERDRLQLVAEAQEPIVELAVREGQAVEAGALLVRLDEARYRAQLEGLKAQRAQADARLADLVQGPRRQEISQAQARLASAESTLTDAQTDLTRARDLVRSGARPRAELDSAVARADSARGNRDAAKAALDLLLAGTRKPQIEAARAALAQVDAQLAELSIVIGRLTVRAPVAGRIDALPFHVGERPPAHATVAVLLSGDAYAQVYVPEPWRARFTPGATFPVRVDGVAQPLEGKVRFVSSEAAFTPYFALTERDRSRLSYLAKIDLGAAGADVPSGVPLTVDLPRSP